MMVTTRVKTTRETAATISTSNPSPSAGRSDPGAAGPLVGRLFAEHSRMVLGLCRLLLRDGVEAEDAAQQVFLSAHRALLGGSAPRDAHAWLAAIARNECRSRIHARMREPLALPEVPSDLPEPLAAAIRALDLEAIWKAIASLPRRQRRALVLRELGGLSYHELGVALGVSHSSVESLLWRARRQVRGLVAAATPLAPRDELARLIPGFDPGSLGPAARVVSLPVTVKLAAAAVSVGVITTGSAQLGEKAAHPEAWAAESQLRAGLSDVPEAAVAFVPSWRPRYVHVETASRRERAGPDRHGGPIQQGHEVTPESEHAAPDREAADVSPVKSTDGDRGGGSGSSGEALGGGGSDSSGSTLAPSGVDSRPDGADG